MDNLEKFAQENRADFDLYEPSPQLWDKVKPKRKSLVPQWTKYAAAAVIVFALGFGSAKFSSSPDRMHLSDAIHSNEEKQIIESEYYYVNQINERMQQLQPYFVSDPRLKSDIEVDFEELDQYCQELKKDLNDNINNEFVIEALIQSYQTKLVILESLIKQLKQDDNEDIKVNI